MYYPNRFQGLKRAKRVVRSWKQFHSDLDEEYHLRYLLKTRHPCSCYMCRNQRKAEGPTRQERLNSIEYNLASWGL